MMAPLWIFNEAQYIAKKTSTALRVVCVGEWSCEKVTTDS